MAVAKKFDLHAALIAMAREEVAKHIVMDDGEKCFNLAAYLEALESRLITVLDARESPTGSFCVLFSEMARYLWCCVALEGGAAPDATTFRGMHVLA